jgi:hypothetical protein
MKSLKNLENKSIKNIKNVKGGLTGNTNPLLEDMDPAMLDNILSQNP